MGIDDIVDIEDSVDIQDTVDIESRGRGQGQEPPELDRTRSRSDAQYNPGDPRLSPIPIPPSHGNGGNPGFRGSSRKSAKGIGN